jgi:hypothetical protein
MALTREQLTTRRDKKVRATMAELAPIWLANEAYRPAEDGLLFNLIYDNAVDGWVSERYKYDGFNDVLYHLGEKRLTEEETLTLQDEEPYIPGEVATRVPNDPAYRPSMPIPGKK